MKRPLNAGELDKVEEKRARLPLQEDVDVPVYPRTPAAPQPEKKPPKYQPCSGDSAVGTTPPGSPPPPPPLLEPPAAAASSSVLKILSTLKPGATNDTTAPPAPAVAAAAASPATSSASKTASPLEHILQTLFGKKKSFDTAAKEPVEPALASTQDAKAKADGGLPTVPLLDPIVQQFGQLSKEKAVEDEEDDRPYDPEEEYGPDRAFDTQLGDHGGRPDADRATESAEREEVAYDPEDETILEEAKVTVHDLPNRMCSDVRGGAGERPAGGAVDGAAPSLAEQQKMLEELSRQIEEQKRQVEEQEAALRQQRAAAGVCTARFSVAEALLSPPPKPALPQAELFPQEQPAAGRAAAPPGSQGPAPGSDPRPSRDPRQARRLAAESSDGESCALAPGSSAACAPPAREAPAPEDKEAWAPGDVNALPARPDGPAGEPSESPAQLPADGGAPSAGTARPARKVLLPTPPGAFPPGFPLPGTGQDFGGPAFPPQYEDPRNAPFADRSDRAAVETEGDRDAQSRPGEGAALFPPPGQKGAPPPPFQGQREPAPRPLGMSGLHGPSFPGPRGPVPPFSEETAMSNSDGSRGPPAARFGAPKGPIPSLFSGPHGPPPYGDNRGPSPSHPGGPRGTAAPQFEERKDPHGEKREFQDSPYEMAGPATQFEGPEQGQFVGGRAAAPFQFGGPRRPLLSQFKGPRGGPPPSQFGGQRGPPPGHFVGPRGPHPSQFEGPRGQAPGFMPGPRGVQPPQFDEQRVTSPPPPRFANQRAPAPLQFAGPRGPAPFPEKNEPARFHFQGQAAAVMKPAPRPLLELPSHPPQHRKDRWDEAGPPSAAPGPGPEAEAPWAAPDFGEGREYRDQPFEARQRGRFEAGPKEKPLDEPAAPPPESRPGRAPDERRREREHGKAWERERGRDWGRAWDRHREWDRSKERGAGRDRGREWERERGRNRGRERERRRGRERSRSRERDRGRDRKDRGRSEEGAREPKAEAPRAADPAIQT